MESKKGTYAQCVQNKGNSSQNDEMKKQNEKHLKTIENLQNKIANQTININGLMTKKTKESMMIFFFFFSKIFFKNLFQKFQEFFVHIKTV